MIRNVAAVKRLASEGARLDGRAMNEYRGPISIQTNVSQTAEGSARVQIGDTVVMAGVKLSLEKPYNDTPDEGGIMINVELLPLSSADYDPGPPGIKAVELARVTDRAIREAKAIDFKKLCIRSGELAWFVSVDILTINDAGNLFDAICLATLVALNQTKLRPYDENTGVVDYKGTTEEALPIIKPSLTNYGTNEKILKNVPITAVLGDQQASLFGQNCVNSGDVKNTYGTGCFALTNTGSEIVYSNNGLLSTVAFQKEGDEPQYALEGSVSIAGAAVQWLRDNLNIINESKEVESLAMSVKDNGDVYFVPAFSGLFSPHWDETARGVLVGLSRFSNKSHIARAVLESVAYQSCELLDSMEKDTGIYFESVNVDGGMVENNLLMQFQSDIFNKKVNSQQINEITALGVAAASYIYLNNLPLDTMGEFITNSQTWSPNMDSKQRDHYLSKWNKAISKAKQWT